MEKRFTKVIKNRLTGRTRTVKFGQAGPAKDGGDRIRPGTAKGEYSGDTSVLWLHEQPSNAAVWRLPS